MVFFLAYLITICHGGLQAQYEFKSFILLEGIARSEQNPFWFYSNRLGMVSQQTQGLGLVEAHYRRYLGESTELEAGGSLFMDYYNEGDNQVRGNEYYASLGWWKLRLTLGARARPQRMLGLSSVNGDLLWSNNARPLPGAEIQTSEPLWLFPWLGVEGALAHYWLNDDRFVEDAYVHFKYLNLTFRLSERSRLGLGPHHYAQWGGVSPVAGPQPSSLEDFIRIFFSAAGDSNASDNDQLNVLGNQLGSWRLNYRYLLDEGEVSVYFQNLFDNTSGLEFNNFPDGVWGAFWELPENSALRGILYEYVRTTWLRDSGRGTGDNYFNNFIYRSGWTYFGRVIGMPFILPREDEPGMLNNRLTSHHLGALFQLSDLSLTFLGSYTTNKGTQSRPFDPEENVLYTQLLLEYPLGEHFHLGLRLGADLSDVNDENLGAGLSVRYLFENAYRM